VHGSQHNAKPASVGMSPKCSTHAHLVRRQVRMARDYADLHNHAVRVEAWRGMTGNARMRDDADAQKYRKRWPEEMEAMRKQSKARTR
jgi:hypothetical protein